MIHRRAEPKVGTSRCGVPAREPVGGTAMSVEKRRILEQTAALNAPLNAARTAQRAIPTLFLPIVKTDLEMDPSVNMKTTMNTEKKRILVVDDQARNTRLVRLYLEGTNDYVVREENDAMAALSAAKEFQPHLILLDVMMPGMDGGELAACFQANPKLKAVPIVFLTAAVTKGEVEAGRGLVGGVPFLAKPVVLVELVACLKRHLDG